MIVKLSRDEAARLGVWLLRLAEEAPDDGFVELSLPLLESNIPAGGPEPDIEASPEAPDSLLPRRRTPGVGLGQALTDVVGSIFARTNDPIHLDQLYQLVQMQRPDLCDDSVPCSRSGVEYTQPQWKHTVRWALQRLKAKNLVRRSSNYGEWVAV